MNTSATPPTFNKWNYYTIGTIGAGYTKVDTDGNTTFFRNRFVGKYTHILRVYSLTVFF
jgi:hypothetical protein